MSKKNRNNRVATAPAAAKPVSKRKASTGAGDVQQTVASASGTKKMTRREADAQAARERLEAQRRKAERKEKLKKAGIIAVCVILVIALGIPTMALSVLSM